MSKLSIFYVCVPFAALAVSGCDEIGAKIDDWLYKGTHIGVQKCIDRNKTETTAVETIRARCVTVHEKSVPVYLTGRASYSEIIFGRVSFRGHVKNTSRNYIVTAFTIRVKHDDMQKDQEDAKSFSGLWIEPDKTYHFFIGADELKIQPEQNGRHKDGDDFLFEWRPTNHRGVEIKVD